MSTPDEVPERELSGELKSTFEAQYNEYLDMREERVRERMQNLGENIQQAFDAINSYVTTQDDPELWISSMMGRYPTQTRAIADRVFAERQRTSQIFGSLENRSDMQH